MKLLLPFLALAILSVVPAYCLAADEEPFDFTQLESPRRPAPIWFESMDQGSKDKGLKGYFTPNGFKLEVVAEFPAVRNPVAMTFSTDGTPYVLEWTRDKEGVVSEVTETFTYKDGTKREVLVLKKATKDVVKMLTFNKEKGVYDAAKVVLEDELPSSLLFHDGWLYLSGRGSVRRYRQSKADGPLDVKETIAQGFGGHGRQQVSGMTIGSDGLLYITAGSGDNYVEGSDGSRATVLRSGAVFRCRPDGSKMEVFAQGFCNPYGSVAFDAAFNMFHTDTGADDGSKFQGCRLLHIVQSADFGWRARPGAIEARPDLVRGSVFGELPGKLAPLLKAGRGLPAGLMIYDDNRFPERYRGLLLYPDPVRRSIRAYKLKPAGSTFEVVQEFELMKSDDPLFRPCQIVTGPDGAMYVVDRHMETGTDQLWGDDKHGRIYRLTWDGVEGDPAIEPRPMDSWAKVIKLGDDELVKSLAGESAGEREIARREIVQRGEKLRAALIKVLDDGDQPLGARVAALGALQSVWNFEVEAALARTLQDSDPAIRRVSANGLGLHAKRGSKKVHLALLDSLTDPDLAARRAVVLAMGQIAGPGAFDNLASAFSFDDGKDPSLSDAYLRAFERGGKDGLERFLSLADSGDQKLIDRVADAYLGLRSREAAEMLPILLKSPHLNATQRAAVLRSYKNYQLDPPISLEPLVEFLEKEAGDEQQIKLAGVEVLASGVPVKPDAVATLLLKYLQDADPKLRAGAIEAAANLRVTKAAPELVKMVTDKARTATERVTVARALGLLGDTGDKSVSAALKELIEAGGKTPAPALLRAEAFHALAAIDPVAAQAIAKDLLVGNHRIVRTEAVHVLGTTAKGARLLGQQWVAKELDSDLRSAVWDVLARHASNDAEAAKLLAALVKDHLEVRTDKDSIDKIREQIREKGDVMRGRLAYVECGCAGCHRIENLGRGVGPDLTRLSETQSVEKLIESIIEPSKEVKHGYQVYTAVTKTGFAFSGMRISQDADEIVLREATGRDIRLLTRDLTALAPSKKSFMPDCVGSQLTMKKFIDLLTLLTTEKAQESLRGMVLDFNVIGPFEGDLKTPEALERKPDPDATYKDQKSGVKRIWQSVQAEPSGLLDVRVLFLDEDDISAYALAYVYSPKSQKAPLLLGAGCTARVWLNDDLVHEQKERKAPWPDETRVEVELQEGWNTFLVKVTSCSTCRGIYLRFDGGDGLKFARRPENK